MRSRPANVHVIGAHDDALSGPAWARFKRPRLSGPPAPPLLATTEDESSASCSPPSTPMSPVVDTHQCGLLASFADEATRPSPATEAATLANARTPCGRLPPELLLHVFSFVEPLDEDRLDRARFTRVCRAWTPPAVMTLYRDIFLTTRAAVSSFCRAIEHRPELASLARTFAYVASEPDAAADGDEIDFLAGRLRHLDSLKLRGDITNSDDIWSNLSPDLLSNLTSLDLSSDQGLWTRHLVSALQLPNLVLLRLGHLTAPAQEMDQLLDAEDVVPPSSLKSLTLFKPNMDATGLQYLLEITQESVTSFGIDMGDATEDMGWISEADVAQALSTAGGNLLELHIMWPRVRTLWLNEAISGMKKMEYITAGGVCCDTKMDRNCPPTLRRMDILVQIGFPGHVFEDLWQPGFRVSNVTRYHVVTRTEEPQDKIEDEWTEEKIQGWRAAAAKLDRVGIVMTGDFF